MGRRNLPRMTARAAEALDDAPFSRPTGRPVAERILRVASKLFGEQGFSRVSLAEIGRAVGQSEGGIHRHFTSKKSLIAAIEERFRVQFELRLREAIAVSTTGVTQLLQTARRVWTEPSTTSLRTQLWSEAGRDRLVRERMLRRRRVARVLLADAISVHRSDGRATTVGLDALAYLVTAVLDGLSISEQVEPDVGGDAFELFVRLVARAVGEDTQSETRLRAAALLSTGE